MGVVETIIGILDALGVIGKVALIVVVIILVIIYVIIPITLNAWENRKEITQRAEDMVETVKEVTPEVIESAKVYCELDQTILSQLRPNTIDSYMLNNVKPQEKMILEHWRDTGDITSCEINILDENLDKYYKNTLNLESASKSIVGCNLVDCLDKYDMIKYLDSQK